MDLGDLRAVGTALSASQVLSAYRAGLFPMGLGESGAGPIGWWAPRRRGVLRTGELRVAKSLRRSARRFEWSVDQRFPEVIAACADSGRSGAWITPAVVDIYSELHDRGHAHSVEVLREGELVGGLYGVAFGSVFAGESMFHRVSDASKVALLRLVEILDAVNSEVPWIIDTQWQTPHLESLGVSEIDGFEYLQALGRAESGPHSQVFLTQ
ncbi:leucyl/phenylalanyl-tRNA--protein transferase [Brevibacterium daeguense]|uniref:Leucyl/phenylalanyl-tRNA--protein transferase n=1 Tax=Brevibacterium daeguense TaxID=909936 RepID=A0ABP8ENU6_9MICO|nr:leucyl/phenylalanyl-tRNA--protein transferase [Brevibacterium daeguense]